MTVRLLAIETATEACSAAVYINGEIMERYQLAPRRHNELILPMCDQVLAEAGVALKELDALAFGCGPGAFTGLRIAASVTQAIALAHDLPVASVSTLANLACQADLRAGEYVLTAIDARMEEIYWAVYENTLKGDVLLIGDERVQRPENIVLQQSITCGIGTGWANYLELLGSKLKLSSGVINSHALPRASVTAELGIKKYLNHDIVGAMQVLPVYLRNQVVQQKA